MLIKLDVQSGTKIEPAHPEFHPQHDRRLVFNDIPGWVVTVLDQGNDPRLKQ